VLGSRNPEAPQCGIPCGVLVSLCIWEARARTETSPRLICWKDSQSWELFLTPTEPGRTPTGDLLSEGSGAR